MPYVEGFTGSGLNEALRHSQAILQRSVEAGVIAASSQRTDRARAEKLPSATKGERTGVGSEEERRRAHADAEQATRPDRTPDRGRLVDISV